MVHSKQLLTLVAAVIFLASYQCVSGKEPDACILIIGGTGTKSLPFVEYYNPDSSVNCDSKHFYMPSKGSAVNASGCFLRDAHQIIIREAGEARTMLIKLTEESTQERSISGSSGTHSVAASVGGDKCVLCDSGKTSGGTRCFEFKTGADKWTLMDLPSTVKGEPAAAVSLDGQFYLISNSARTLYVNLYDAKGKWQQVKTKMVVSDQRYSAAAISSQEFIVCAEKDGSTTCDIYDVVKKIWDSDKSESVVSVADGRSKYAIVSFNGKAYAIGGYSTKSKLASTLVSVFENDAWKPAKSLTNARVGFVTIVVSQPSATTTSPATTAPPPTTEKDDLIGILLIAAGCVFGISMLFFLCTAVCALFSRRRHLRNQENEKRSDEDISLDTKFTNGADCERGKEGKKWEQRQRKQLKKQQKRMNGDDTTTTSMNGDETTDETTAGNSTVGDTTVSQTEPYYR